MYIFHAGRMLNKAWISSWKEAGGKIQRLMYILRVRKKNLLYIYICTGITSRCNSDHLWRVRVQVNFIFFFPIWMCSLQNDLQWPSPGTHTWAILTMQQGYSMWPKDCSRMDGPARCAEVTKVCSFHLGLSLFCSLIICFWGQPCHEQCYGEAHRGLLPTVMCVTLEANPPASVRPSATSLESLRQDHPARPLPAAVRWQVLVGLSSLGFANNYIYR